MFIKNVGVGRKQVQTSEPDFKISYVYKKNHVEVDRN